MRSAISGNLFDRNRMMTYFLELMKAVRCLHYHDVVHSDIKPDNIVWVSSSAKYGDGHFKLLDFGLAIPYFSFRDKQDTDLVSPGFRPFELWIDDTNFGPKIDLWSLGAVFYSAVTKNTYIYESIDKPIYNNYGYITMQETIFGTPEEKDWPGIDNLLQDKPKLLQDKQIMKDMIKKLGCTLR